MSRMTIFESKMNFGPFECDDVFHVEKSNLYTKLQKGVRIAEFVIRRKIEEGNAFWIVEAKSSSPQPGKENFALFISEVAEKWINTFQLTAAASLSRHGEVNDLPPTFGTFLSPAERLHFVLVMRGHKDEWLPPLSEKLNDTLRSFLKTWHIGPNSIRVLNDARARSEGLIE